MVNTIKRNTYAAKNTPLPNESGAVCVTEALQMPQWYSVTLQLSTGVPKGSSKVQKSMSNSTLSPIRVQCMVEYKPLPFW
jgi:hypothetical protein